LDELQYPKRLIEVDLPIKKISYHSYKEKGIKSGHISTIHLWWARRPLSACRAVLCASIWPDPVDPFCSETFRKETAQTLQNIYDPLKMVDLDYNDPLIVRNEMLRFIGDFADYINAKKPEYLDVARKITNIALESYGYKKDEFLLVDSFAGGGSIPIEGLRIGMNVYASDLNPVALLINKAIIEYLPKFKNTLISEVGKENKL